MKQLEELWNKFQLWRKWKKTTSDKTVIDLTRYAGYFFPVGISEYNPKATPSLIKMQSGKLMRAKLLDYKLYRDPADRQDEKAFKDMMWGEYKEAHYGA